MRNPDVYRARAEELRTIAESVEDASARKALFQCADDYEQMAICAESRKRVPAQ